MTHRLAAKGLLGLALALMLALESAAAGLGFGPLLTTVDLTGTYAKVPMAAEDAFDAVDSALADLGLPPADRAELRDGFEETLAGVEEALAFAPTILPVPLLGGFIEIPLPLVVVDAVRLAGGYLSDGLARSFADLAGFSIPSPLVDVAFDEDGFSGSVEADVAFRSWLLATELSKRLDVLLAAIDLCAGVHMVGGEATPTVEIDVPAELADGVADALEALHLDGITWSAFALHAGVGIETGPPFLRIGLMARFVLPLSVTSGWWDVGIGGVGGAASVVIRF